MPFKTYVISNFNEHFYFTIKDHGFFYNCKEKAENR